MSRTIYFVIGLCVALLPASGQAQEAAPDVAPEAAPEAVSDVAPEAAPDVAPDVAPEAGPDVAPEAAPEAAPDVAPEAAPDVAPDPQELDEPPWPWVPGGATTERIGTEVLAMGVAVTNSFYRRDHRDYGLRFELYGQYTFETDYMGEGIFVSAPYTVQGNDGDMFGMPGSLDLRFFVVPYMSRYPLIIHVGVALGLDYYDDIGRAYDLALSAGRGRTTDLAAQLPSSTWMRTAGSFLYREGRIVARLDLGVDGRLAKSERYRIGSEDFRAQLFLRANGAAGFDAGPVVVMAEAVIIGEYYDLGLISPTLALTATGRYGMYEPFASAVVPFQGSVSGDIPVMLMAGLRVVPPMPRGKAKK